MMSVVKRVFLKNRVLSPFSRLARYSNGLIARHEVKSPKAVDNLKVYTKTIPKRELNEKSDEIEEDIEDLEEMFVMGPAGIEWNGPTRGGSRPEPTRFGDWERKGRVSDF